MKGRFSNAGRRLATVALLITAFLALAAGTASAGTPLYDVHATWGPTILPPGGEAMFKVDGRNIHFEADAGGAEDLIIEDELPEDVTATGVAFLIAGSEDFSAFFCSGVGTRTVVCDIPSFFVPALGFGQSPGIGSEGLGNLNQLPYGMIDPVFIQAAVDPGATGTGVNRATISGGEAPTPANEMQTVHFGTPDPSLDVVPGSFTSDVFEGAYPAPGTARHAGDHPYEQRVDFDFTAHRETVSFDGTPWIVSNGVVRTVEVTLPRGAVGNPEATAKCDPTDFAKAGSTAAATGCPPDTQVGYLDVLLAGGGSKYGNGAFNNPNALTARVPIYNLEPPKGTPADFGFNAGGFVQGHIYAKLDPAQNYAIKTVTPNISNNLVVRGARVTFWGVPGDESHKNFRTYPDTEHEATAGAPFGDNEVQPLITNPLDCGFDNGGSRIRIDSYNHEDQFSPIQEYPTPLNVHGCEDPRIRFNPDVELQPTNRDAGASTGLAVHLKVPQRNYTVSDVKKLYGANGYTQGVGTPPMKKAIVTFPEGMTINSGAAQGLGVCTAAEIGLGTDDPVGCPDSSQYGTLILHTPILPIDEQPEGFIYVAKQNDNPFHNFLSMYMVIQEPERGILIKIPFRLDLNQRTGQLTGTFDDLPQLPMSDMEMRFKGGNRAGLVNPSTCGTKTIRAEFFSWADPTTPHVVDNNYAIANKPDGSPCVNSLGDRPFNPTMEGGTESPTAGSYPPFAFRTTRSDDDQEFSQISTTVPEGLAAKLAGVESCPETGIAQALSRETTAGDGALEESDPSCPASSQIGTTQVGTGVGSVLSWVPGKVYLAGPYKGAPMSMVAISPAKVGPYDLGVITVRTALNVDRETAQVQAVTDAFPQIFQGIPVRIRDIRLNLDRSNFTYNPTSCAEKQIDGQITGTGGNLLSTADDSTADLSERFQAADCASLGFKPKLYFRLYGGTHRGAHPKLRAVVKPRAGDANIAGASVALPHSEFLDQGHIKTVCTRVQFAADACPAGSIYGHVQATTPILEEPLQGPVYLRSSSHKLPDLVAVLKGPSSRPIEVDLDGRIDSVNGGIRNTFEVVPDAPVSSFVLTMQGGKKGLLQNSTNICAKAFRSTAKFSAQNGRAITLHPKMKAACGKKAKRTHRRHHR